MTKHRRLSELSTPRWSSADASGPDPIVKKYRSYLENYRSGVEGKNAKGHYHAGFACACFAWREILGGYIAGDFIEELQTVFYESFDLALSDRIPPGDEFTKIARDSLKAVLVELPQYNPDNPNDPDDPAIQKYLRDRANRNFGSHHLDEINTAPGLDDSAFPINGQTVKARSLQRDRKLTASLRLMTRGTGLKPAMRSGPG